jgi:hypothetical protein
MLEMQSRDWLMWVLKCSVVAAFPDLLDQSNIGFGCTRSILLVAVKLVLIGGTCVI